MSYYTTIEFKLVVKPEHRSDMKYVAGHEWGKVTDGLLVAFHDAALPYTRWGEIPFGGKWNEQTGIWELEGDFNKLSYELEEYILGLVALIASHVFYYRRMEEDDMPWTYYKFDYLGNAYYAPRTIVELKAELKPEYVEHFKAFLGYRYWPDDPAEELSDILPFPEFVRNHQQIFLSDFKGTAVQDNTLTLNFWLYNEDYYVEDLLDMLVFPAAKRIEHFSMKRTEKYIANADISFLIPCEHRGLWGKGDY